MSRHLSAALALTLLAAGVPLVSLGQAPANPAAPVAAKSETKSTDTAAKARPAPKPLSENTKRGLAYLISQQQPDGGWGQGGGWRTANQAQGGRVEGKDVKDPTDVGNTCIATLALIRAGHTPKTGEYAKQVTKAVEYICGHVDKSDKKSLYVTDVRDTQLQSKIGTYVDTFLTAMVLSELKGKMPDEAADKKLIASLDKTIGKIEANQKEDGTFADNNGWAAVLSQGLCSKALNRARQVGANVKDETLSRDFAQTVAQLDTKTGDFKGAGAAGASTRAGLGRSAGRLEAAAAAAEPVPADVKDVAGADTKGRAGKPTASPVPSDAGVGLYNFSANGSRLQDRANGLQAEKEKAEKVLADKSAPAEAKAKAKQQIEEVDQVYQANTAAVKGLVRQLDDKKFIEGFGNKGGEEFLSYMNISETLLANGGQEWESWSKSIADGIHRAQNEDGSWSGHHCITGRTFCTAAALLTLMADRAPVPLAAELKKK
jgi:hypothetical protein